uniref:Metallo-beta-lactamase domain-containing protein n=1 Tax=Pyricularia oryzae (strain P131) TaxID=1143193 RepID=L7IT35_PYRO1
MGSTNNSTDQTTLEWFGEVPPPVVPCLSHLVTDEIGPGATTFRLRTRGVTIFLDTWLDKPSVMPKYLAVDDVTEADYIFISHAHFDHLPGADRIAIKTGATVIANGEAINCLRNAGVPEEQLIPVAGGERIPLFTRAVREQARQDPSLRAKGFPGAPIFPLHTLAALAVHVWPSLHCLMPADHPDVIDTATVYTGSATPYSCSLDITFGMKHGLLRLGELVPPEKLHDGQRSFIEYVSDRKRNVFSHCDGGQLMFNFLIGDKALLWSAHLGAYEGIMKDMQPKPDVAILAIAGRANLNGRPFDGSAAQFAVKEVEWLGSPSKVIWALHDETSYRRGGRIDRIQDFGFEARGGDRVGLVALASYKL